MKFSHLVITIMSACVLPTWAQSTPTTAPGVAAPSATAAAAVAKRTVPPPGVVAVTPSEMVWSALGALTQPGVTQTNIIGSPDKPGSYTIRLRFPAGAKLDPHGHPDTRVVTVLSGVWATGYGEKFDAEKLIELPAGSVYEEPAGVPHFVLVKEPTEIQVTGTGPSKRLPVHSSKEQ